MSSERIYLDHNATTPVDPRVLQTMLPYFTEKFGNAASIDHDFGYEAKKAVDEARESVAALIGAQPDEIIFTSGATESNNMVLFGVAERYKSKGSHIITVSTEHKAILDTARHLEQVGSQVTYLPVDSTGLVSPDSIRSALTPRTILISVMAANNEIGTLAPLDEIGEIASKNGVLFHTDAAQAYGHIPLDVRRSNIHLMSMSAHKIYGPKGIGALYVRRGNPYVKLTPRIFGGGHERGLRSGTLNVPAIVGFGVAAMIARQEMLSDAERFRTWTSLLLMGLQASIPLVHLNGHPSKRLPNNLNITIDGVESKALVIAAKGVALSAGSACTTQRTQPSHVIEALGFGVERAHHSLRISVGRYNTEAEINAAISIISAATKKVKSGSL